MRNCVIPFHCLLVAIVLLLSCTSGEFPRLEKGGPAQPVFISGEDGYTCYRIPAIVPTSQGHLLAFAEGRKNGCSDAGDIDLVMKRSEDNGSNGVHSR